MSDFVKLKDCVVTNKNVLLRVDVNVPMKDGKVEDDTRIRAVMPTIQYLVDNKAKVIIVSHFGRPKGVVNKEMSLKPLVPAIEDKLATDSKVLFAEDCVGNDVAQKIADMNYGQVILLENLRFHKEEADNDEGFARKLASYANLYVNDAFSCSHRAHASIVGVANKLKSCAGLLLESELENLAIHIESAQKPMMAIIGGAKVSSKYSLINNLIGKADSVAIGGGMANSFLYALGHNIGQSLCEKDLKGDILKIIAKAKSNNCEIILPTDVVVTKKFENNAKAQIVKVSQVADDDIIGDLGKESLKNLGSAVKNHKTIVWNGPLGAFETKPFDNSTFGLARAIGYLTKNGKMVSIAGGGDVVSAINSVQVASEFTYLSTAGGAFLEWLEGKDLPGVAAIKK